MAYVAITKQLLADVDRVFTSLQDKETATLPKIEGRPEQIIADPEIKKLIDDLLWKDEPDLYERLAKYSRKDSIKLIIKDPRWTSDFESSRLEYKAPCFMKPADYWDPRKIVLTSDAHPLLMQFVMDVTTVRECNERWNAVKKSVTTFLQKCKSLNEAIKLWPDLTRYIPKEYLDRVAEKKDRAERAKKSDDALAALDTDLIHTSTVLATLTGGTK